MNDGTMVYGSAFVLSEPNQHHFHQAGFDLSREPRVWFDPIYDDNVVRF